MILALNLPRAGQQMTHGSVHRLVARPGDEIRPGTPLLEVRVDLEAEKAQDCPPLFFFRVLSTERGVLRSLAVEPGSLLAVGAPLGIVTTTAAEPADGAPARPLRTTQVAIQIDPLSRRQDAS